MMRSRLVLNEEFREGDFRIFKAIIKIPKEYEGRDIRLITLWNTSRQYGVGGCILANNYENRGDEPVSLVINGVKLNEYTFDISQHAKYGQENTLRLEVLAEEPPDEILIQRSSVVQYLSYDIEAGKRVGKVINAGFFEEISRSFLRIGKKIDLNNIHDESYCSILNPDFSVGTLEGWTYGGQVVADNDDHGKGRNYFVRLTGESMVEQKVNIEPGLYYLKLNTRNYEGSGNVGIKLPGGERVSEPIFSRSTWKVNTVLFEVPEDAPIITIFAECCEGEILMDDFRIIANMTAKIIQRN